MSRSEMEEAIVRLCLDLDVDEDYYGAKHRGRVAILREALTNARLAALKEAAGVAKKAAEEAAAESVNDQDGWHSCGVDECCGDEMALKIEALILALLGKEAPDHA